MRLIFAVLLAALSAGSISAQPLEPELTPVPVDAQGEAVSNKIFQEIEKAEALYVKGAKKFQEGDYKKAKRDIQKSFKILSSLMVEEGLVGTLGSDVEALIGKIKNAEIGMMTSTGAVSALDVSPEELAEAKPLGAKPDGNGRYTIRIDPENALTQRYLALYTKSKRRPLVLQALERSGRYRDMILRELQKAGLPKELLWLVMVESEFKAKGLSRVGAGGLWQLMPATGRKLGLKVNYWIDERYDPEKATRAALQYLKELYHLFDDWHLALAAYNRGEHGIGRDLAFSKSVEFDQLSMRSALPKETEDFVPKFMACVLMGDNPGDYDFDPKYENPEPFNYPEFELRIPRGTKEKFLEKLATVKDWNPTRGFVRYKVRSGDILGVIARRHQTTVQAIMKDNKIKNVRMLRPGQVLNIRPGKGYFSKGK
ncbi:MAG: transglycosylase SLT domain-containing protein [Elusimicrobia bacterium]|nr:transglycosylase SLT domain-containing protein [Elusimicrobiota bacterium]